MGMFDNLELDEEVLKEQSVSAGSGQTVKFGKLRMTGGYKVTIEKAYGSYSDKGAMEAILHLKTADGLSVIHKEWIVSGNVKGNKPMFTFGKYVKANDILGLGKKAPKTEKKTIMLYDFNAGKEVPEEKEVFTEWIGKTITVTGFRLWEDAYPDKTAAREKFSINHFLANDDTSTLEEFNGKFDKDYINDKREQSINSENPDEAIARKAAEKAAKDKEIEDANNPEAGGEDGQADNIECPF